MTAENGNEQDAILKAILEQTRDGYFRQGEILKRIDSMMSTPHEKSEASWFLDLAADALRKAAATGEKFRIGTKSADELLETLASFEKEVTVVLGQMRDRILIAAEGSTDEAVEVLRTSIDYESLKEMTDGNRNFWRDFDSNIGGEDTTTGERELGRRIALSIIARNGEYTSTSGKTDDNHYFSDSVFSKVPAESKWRLALLYWIATRHGIDREPAFDHATIGRILVWPESKVKRQLRDMRGHINDIVSRQPSYRPFIVEQKYGGNSDRNVSWDTKKQEWVKKE